MATNRFVSGAVAPAPTPAAPQLIVLSGPNQGDVVVLDDSMPLVIGRRAGLSLADPELDPVHCQVFHAGGRWFVQDFGSPAGTLLGDERVDGTRALEPGRIVRVGQTTLVLVVGAVGALPLPPLASVHADAAPDETGTVELKIPPGGFVTAADAAPPAPPEARRATSKKKSEPVGQAPPTSAHARAPHALDRTDIFTLETPPPVAVDLEASPAAVARAADEAGAAAAKAVAKAPARPDLGDHDKVGDYDIIKELGRGELGRVYKGYDRKRRRVVAVKILDPEVARDPATVGRLLRGAQAGARLQHPSIVAVLAAGHADGRIYVTMEYVEGLDLGAACEAAGGRLPPRTAVPIVARVVDALVYAHGKDVIHRHVSPRNVIVGPGGTTKLTDLALAKRLGTPDRKQMAITHAGQVLTRSPYAAPEVYFDVQRVDHRADVFGVGATLYRTLTGHLPYEGSPLESLQKLQEGRHEDPRKWVKNLSPGLAAILDRCLKPDPKDRYQAMRDLREAFSELPEASEGG